jgi:hypothetical protein
MEKRAIAIGINDYPGYANDLSGCVNDARDWADVLHDGYGFTVQIFTDQRATRTNIIRSIEALFLNAVKGDSIVITYSGHGTQVADSGGDEVDRLDEAICLYDALLYDDELWALFRTKPTGVRLVFISDSCHSGTVAKAFAPLGVGKPRYMPTSKAMQIYKLRDTRPEGQDERAPWPCLLLSGCQDTEYSYDSSFGGRANGAFSKAALDALKRMNKLSTYGLWYDAIRKILPSADHPQTPNILGSYQTTRIFK